MTLGDFMDVLGRLHKLTPAQRRAVAEVLAETEAVSEPVEAGKPVGENLRASMNRRPYSHGNRLAFADAAYHWEEYSPEQQKTAVAALATRLGRTEKAIRLQIQERIRLHIQQDGK
jgi:hypothetical protein